MLSRRLDYGESIMARIYVYTRGERFHACETGKYYKIVRPLTARVLRCLYKSDDSTPSFDRIITKIWKLQHTGDINPLSIT